MHNYMHSIYVYVMQDCVFLFIEWIILFLPVSRAAAKCPRSLYWLEWTFLVPIN